MLLRRVCLLMALIQSSPRTKWASRCAGYPLGPNSRPLYPQLSCFHHPPNRFLLFCLCNEVYHGLLLSHRSLLVLLFSSLQKIRVCQKSMQKYQQVSSQLARLFLLRWKTTCTRRKGKPLWADKVRHPRIGMRRQERDLSQDCWWNKHRICIRDVHSK